MDKWGYIKLQSFYTSKKTISKIKKNNLWSKRYICKPCLDKKLISTIYKERITQKQKQKKKNGPRI